MGAFDLSIGTAFLAGLLSFLSPCILPLVPAYLGFLGGTSLHQMAAATDSDPARHAARRVALAALFFVAGFATVFVALGATASAIGKLLIAYLEPLTWAAGTVLILFGLHTLGWLKLTWLYRDMRFHSERRPAGLLGAYVVGLAFALGWTPCVGPILAAILTLAAGTESVARGSGLLAVYAAGIGLPFLAAALAGRPFLHFISRFRQHIVWVERITGALLIATGIAILTGTLPEVGYWLLEVFPVLGQIG
ncbi:MAG: cytochrome c biogenesis protein CcdA [Alphaproteobacteria bacterium]|nr:cytochrome c biogenesis protein CcdA [Alphaproteobacteria bacterium]